MRGTAVGLGVACWVMLSAASAAAQQAAAPEKCEVEGQVVRAGTGEPLKKARVVLRQEESQEMAASATTDERGRFQVKDVEPGRYRLFAGRNGYAQQEYGQRGPNRPGTVLTLAPGQQVKGIVFRLQPAAVIAGKVYDEDGEAVPRVMVQALQQRYLQGQRRLSPAGQATTNDRGEYRIYGLAAGRYYVIASYRPTFGSFVTAGGAVLMSPLFGSPGQEESYAPIYYPNTNDPARATPLELRAGSEIAGIDFLLLPTRAVSVRGRVYNAVTGKPGRDVSLNVVDPSARFQGFFTRPTGRTEGAEGKFEVRGVVPGSYLLLAYWEDEQTNQFYIGRALIQVGDSNLEGVEVVIERGADVPGSLRVEGGEEATREAEPETLDLAELRVVLWPQDESSGLLGSGGTGPVQDDGSFLLQNIPRRPYWVSLSRRGGLPGNYYLKEGRLEGDNVLEQGLDLSAGPPRGRLELVISPNGGSIEGAALKEQQPFSGATVVLAPEPKRRERRELFKTTTTDQYGRFTLRGIAPGEYKLFAWEEIEPGAHQDAEFLRPYEDKGYTVKVEEGSRLGVELKLIPTAEAR